VAEPEGTETRPERVAWLPRAEEFIGRWIALPLLAALVVLSVVVAFQANSADVRRPASGFLSALLADPVVLAISRIATVAAGLFVFGSVVSLTARHAWLSRVGPAETQENVTELSRERDDLAADLREARDHIGSLRRQLEEATNALEAGRTD
jgi:hypothetical protein